MLSLMSYKRQGDRRKTYIKAIKAHTGTRDMELAGLIAIAREPLYHCRSYHTLALVHKGKGYGTDVPIRKNR